MKIEARHGHVKDVRQTLRTEEHVAKLAERYPFPIRGGKLQISPEIGPNTVHREDTLGWIFQAEEYFDYHGIGEEAIL